MNTISGHIEKLTSPEVVKYIQEHINSDVNELAFSKTDFSLPFPLVLAQLKSRQKAQKKLPTWVARYDLLFPFHENLAQSSSEITATYKGSLFSGKAAADLTGGFGVDSYFLSQRFAHFDYCDPQEDLLAIARHNFNSLGRKNIDFHPMSAGQFLSKSSRQYDLIYLDPSRKSQKGRVFRLQDSQPDAVHLQNKLLECARLVLIKASPMVSIPGVCEELRNMVHDIHVVSVGNECREVLFVLKNETNTSPTIHCVNFTSAGREMLSFSKEEELQSPIELAQPLTYIYEPNASILKAGAFRSVAKRYLLNKLEKNTHLYTSNTFVEDFPGRIFRKLDAVSLNWKKLKKRYGKQNYHLISRNFNLETVEIQKRLGTSPAGNFLIFTSTLTGFQCIEAQRLK